MWGQLQGMGCLSFLPGQGFAQVTEVMRECFLFSGDCHSYSHHVLNTTCQALDRPLFLPSPWKHTHPSHLRHYSLRWQ